MIIPLLFLVLFNSFSFGEEDSLPAIPTGSCSFDGDRLCQGVPGPVVQKHLQEGACGDSLARLCAFVEPGEGRLAKCLRDNGRFLDAKCKNWGKDVGLNFVDPNRPEVQKKPQEASMEYLNMFGSKPDPCFGSAYFTNSGCRNPAPSLDDAPRADDIAPLIIP